MKTERGFALLQLVADNASDWHDAIERNGVVTPSVTLMTNILAAQVRVFHGRKLHRDPIRAAALFVRWEAAYDMAFRHGMNLGLVPYDKVDRTHSTKS